MVLVLLPFSQSPNSQKTSQPFLLLAIPAIHKRPALDVEGPSQEDEANEGEEPIPEEEEDNSKESEDEVASKVTTNMTTGEAGVELVVVEDSGGKITINHSGTAMRLLISSLTGRCWRKLISIVWLS